MAWYIRKSFRVGPLLRLNLSKSGLGYSFGIKGARIGTGPRGNYVHVGRYGLYYRQSLPSSKPAPVASPEPLLPESATDQIPQIPTAEASALKDQSARDLLSEIQQKHQTPRLAPVAAGASAILFLFLLLQEAPVWLVGIVALLGSAMSLILMQYDRERKTILLQFHLDDSMRTKYDSLLNAIKALSGCSIVWRLWTQQSVRDPKYHAGARTLVSKKQAGVTLGPPPFFQIDLPVWCLALGNQNLYLFPDRILIYQGKNVGAVSYSDLQVQSAPTRFVEDSSLPSDTTILGYTWLYTNRDGGPDHRFSNNRQIPIVEYAEIRIMSSTGLNILLQASSVQKAEEFVRGVNEYGRSPNLSRTPDLEQGTRPLPSSAGLTMPNRGYIAAPVILAQDGSDAPGREGRMFCTSCGAKNPTEARFCNQCGKPIVVSDISDRSAAVPAPVADVPGSDQAQRMAGPPAASDAERATSMVLVDILNKRYQETEYEKYLWWDATYNPVRLAKATRAIKGTVEFADLFGEVHFRLQVVINDPMNPGRKFTTPGVGFTMNQFMEDHQWMLATDISDMTVKFRIQSIIYTDGTKETL